MAAWSTHIFVRSMPISRSRTRGADIFSPENSRFICVIRDLLFSMWLAQLLQVRGLGGRNVIVLEFNLVNAVLVGNHLGNVEQLESTVRVVVDIRNLQDVLKVQRHDRNAIERRLFGILRWLRPCRTAACGCGHGGGGQEKFTPFHSTLLL